MTNERAHEDFDAVKARVRAGATPDPSYDAVAEVRAARQAEADADEHKYDDKTRLLATIQRLTAENEYLWKRDRKLSALECMGVDNWGGYDDAMDLRAEWDAEDAEKSAKESGGDD